MQGLGYKEILDYLNGELTLDEAVYILKRDTRHFAKRQLTWFRRERDVRWLQPEAFGGSREEMLDAVLRTAGKRSGSAGSGSSRSFRRYKRNQIKKFN